MADPISSIWTTGAQQLDVNAVKERARQALGVGEDPVLLAAARAPCIAGEAARVLRSRWKDVQPRAKEQNAFLKSQTWDEYAQWYLGLTESARDETKTRYAFIHGDFRRIHRMG